MQSSDLQRRNPDTGDLENRNDRINQHDQERLLTAIVKILMDEMSVKNSSLDKDDFRDARQLDILHPKQISAKDGENYGWWKSDGETISYQHGNYGQKQNPQKVQAKEIGQGQLKNDGLKDENETRLPQKNTPLAQFGKFSFLETGSHTKPVAGSRYLFLKPFPIMVHPKEKK